MKKSSGFKFLLLVNLSPGTLRFFGLVSLLTLFLLPLLSFSFYPAVAKEEHGVQNAANNSLHKETKNLGTLTVELTTQFGDGQSFYAGDQVSLLLSLDQPGYLSIFYTDSAQQTAMIFPNAYDKDQRYPAGDFMAIPRESSAFKLVVGPPFGTDKVWVFVTSEPVDLKPLPQESLAQLKTRARTLAENRKLSFGESSVSFQTSPR